MTEVTSLADVINTLDFSVIQDNILMVIGASAAFVIGMIALRKGYAFLKKQIKGAQAHYTKDKILLTKEGYENIEIEVDGNVSFENAKLMREAGASIFVAGTSSVFSKEATIDENIDKLNKILE